MLIRITSVRMKVVSRATFSLCGFSFFDASPARTPPGARYRSRILTVLKAGHFSTLENHRNIFPSPLDKGRVLLRLPAPARVRAAGPVPIFFLGFFPGFVPHPLKFMDICKFNGFP